MSWGQVAKAAFIAVAKEIEQRTASEREATCSNPICGHKRHEHCSCGESCNGDRDGGTAACTCKGFEHPAASST